ncbi:MAG: lytic transglycosylase domain-containing protein [Candidatus Berkelbacteria bacterium]|nr:lytic transglycosylase domain-containing protein [Candidatus Berkelbacteria bacterium]
MLSKKAKLNLGLVIVLICVLGLSTYYYVPKMFADEVYPLKYADWIVKYSTKYSVDPALVCGVILQESRFNPSSVSGAGAQGLMQFMPGTAATMAKETGHWPNYNIFDAETSIEFGAAHIRDLLVKYNGSVELALYGYNAGTGNSDRAIGREVYLRTNNSYVRKIMNYQTAYHTMYAKELGLEPVKIEKKDNSAEIRGFVWSQIFSNFITGLSGNKNNP